MSAKSNRIGVVAIGEVPDIALKVIAAHISGYLNLHATVLPPLEHPFYALDRERLQYNVAAILKQLEPMQFKGVSKVVGVLSVDLFVPLFTHVFGEARQGGKVALVSLFRLKQGAPEHSPLSPQVLEREAKVALHELCHLYNLHHCDDRKCLMHFSGGLEDLDSMPLYFCRYCSKFFRDAVHRHSRE
ncbi:MAG: zinc metallopeptidase [Deltaproteobacteria bacterium]|nr:zinc metallopeptidase [Deltaproteobacteria bacterium]